MVVGKPIKVSTAKKDVYHICIILPFLAQDIELSKYENIFREQSSPHHAAFIFKVVHNVVGLLVNMSSVISTLSGAAFILSIGTLLGYKYRGILSNNNTSKRKTMGRVS